VHRVDKLSKELTRELSKIILFELNDPRIDLAKEKGIFLTVTKTELSKNLQDAKVHICMFGESKRKRLVAKALQHARGFIQSTLAKRLRIRYMPQIRFVIQEEPPKEGEIFDDKEGWQKD
jgi:ribosome-binding factor A